VTRPSAPGVPSSVPRAFTAALVPASVEQPPVIRPAPTIPVDAVETEEPTSRAQFSPPQLVAPGSLPAPVLNPPLDDEPVTAAPLPEPVPDPDAAHLWDEEPATRERVPASAPGEALPEGPNYLLWAGWIAAGLIVAGAVWLTFFK
jgi:hypothetical protein